VVAVIGDQGGCWCRIREPERHRRLKGRARRERRRQAEPEGKFADRRQEVRGRPGLGLTGGQLRPTGPERAGRTEARLAAEIPPEGRGISRLLLMRFVSLSATIVTKPALVENGEQILQLPQPVSLSHETKYAEIAKTSQNARFSTVAGAGAFVTPRYSVTAEWLGSAEKVGKCRISRLFIIRAGFGAFVTLAHL
jgi:hypothetical protein